LVIIILKRYYEADPYSSNLLHGIFEISGLQFKNTKFRCSNKLCFLLNGFNFRRLKVKWFILLMLFSGVSQAITEKQLIEKYGKKRIVKFISEKTNGKLTIIFNDEMRSAHMPSPEYVTASTIRIDLKTIGSSANKVDSIFTKIQKEKEEKVANEKRILIELENERRLRKEARLLAEEKERLRPKDKYDLAVAVAVNKGLKIQAENEKKLAKERRYQKKYEIRKKEQYQYQSTSSTGGNPVCAISINKVINDLKSVYSKKYPDSYSTQKMLIDNNISSYKELCRERVNDISVRILKKHINKYYPNFSTIKMLYNNDMKAYKKLSNY